MNPACSGSASLASSTGRHRRRAPGSASSPIPGAPARRRQSTPSSRWNPPPPGKPYRGRVGPAAASLLSGDSLVRLEPRLPDAVEPIGLHEEFWPDFSRHEIQEGDRLLLLSEVLASTFSDEELAEALRPHPEDTLPVLYGRAKEMRDWAGI